MFRSCGFQAVTQPFRRNLRAMELMIAQSVWTIIYMNYCDLNMLRYLKALSVKKSLN